MKKSPVFRLSFSCRPWIPSQWQPPKERNGPHKNRIPRQPTKVKVDMSKILDITEAAGRSGEARRAGGGSPQGRRPHAPPEPPAGAAGTGGAQGRTPRPPPQQRAWASNGARRRERSRASSAREAQAARPKNSPRRRNPRRSGRKQAGENGPAPAEKSAAQRPRPGAGPGAPGPVAAQRARRRPPDRRSLTTTAPKQRAGGNRPPARKKRGGGPQGRPADKGRGQKPGLAGGRQGRPGPGEGPQQVDVVAVAAGPGPRSGGGAAAPRWAAGPQGPLTPAAGPPGQAAQPCAKKAHGGPPTTAQEPGRSRRGTRRPLPQRVWARDKARAHAGKGGARSGPGPQPAGCRSDGLGRSLDNAQHWSAAGDHADDRCA